MSAPDPVFAALCADEPAAYRLVNAEATRPVLLVCEHASKRLPKALEGAYPAAVINSHYGCDIGTDALVAGLAGRLDARAVVANYSRIVIDCNRRLDDPTLVMAAADGEPLMANTGLDGGALAARIDALYAPFHATVEDQLRQLSVDGALPIYIAIHSFTASLNHQSRPWDAGLMWDTDDRIALRLHAALGQERALMIGLNEPYSGKAPEDFSIDYHAERNGLANVAIEIRQDHLSTAEGIDAWATRLALALGPILDLPALQQRPVGQRRVPEFVSEAARFSAAARAWGTNDAR